jgi:hypothetical protein
MNFRINGNVNLIIRSEELEWKIHGEIKETFMGAFKLKFFLGVEKITGKTQKILKGVEILINWHFLKKTKKSVIKKI